MGFDTHSQTTKEGNYHEEIDAFLVRYPENGTFYWVGIGEATSQKMELRFDSKINHPSIN